MQVKTLVQGYVQNLAVTKIVLKIKTVMAPLCARRVESFCPLRVHDFSCTQSYRRGGCQILFDAENTRLRVNI